MCHFFSLEVHRDLQQKLAVANEMKQFYAICAELKDRLLTDMKIFNLPKAQADFVHSADTITQVNEVDCCKQSSSGDVDNMDTKCRDVTVEKVQDNYSESKTNQDLMENKCILLFQNYSVRNASDAVEEKCSVNCTDVIEQHKCASLRSGTNVDTSYQEDSIASIQTSGDLNKLKASGLEPGVSNLNPTEVGNLNTDVSLVQLQDYRFPAVWVCHCRPRVKIGR